MIQIYKNYEGHKELEELDHIELESWVMITDPTMEELMNISRDYKIDMDDLKADNAKIIPRVNWERC